ncbi:disulfide isomerase-like protein [Dermatophagoides farinae]|nr:disulfide isomerase-like protein [Dermatophagoides farinae]
MTTDNDIDESESDDQMSMDNNNNNNEKENSNENVEQQQESGLANSIVQENKIDLQVNIRIRKKQSPTNGMNKMVSTKLPISSSSSSSSMIVSLVKNVFSKKILFPLILLLSILALVLLHNGSLNTRKTPTPKKIFSINNPFITEFEFGQIKELWARILQTEIAFIMFYAPWDSDSIRARSEIEIVANHYGQQIFFAAINCWWPDGECRKYHNLRRYPHFVAHIRSEGEIEYKGPILASYIIPFLDNVMNPLIPVQNEGELLDLRAQHDAVVLGYFDFNQSPGGGGQIPSGYRAYLTTSIKALSNDPWRSVVFTVVTNSRVAMKLKIDPQREQSSLIIFVGNSTEHFTAKFSKPFTLLSWIQSRAELARTIRWMNPSGVKSTLLSDFIRKTPTFVLFTPRSFLLGISPYYDLLREIVLDYNNCDNSPVIRSLIHRNILRRRLLEERLAELEERCHELLDSRDDNDDQSSGTDSSMKTSRNKFQDSVDTCCHTQTVKWRSFGGARHGMRKKCLCTSCVHIYLPKCPARCQNFDCFSTASRYLDEFDPNYVNNSAVYCNQIKDVYQPKYTPYYKIVTTCSGNLQESLQHSDSDNNHQLGKQWAADEKINRMIKEFEIQHCRKLKLGMNYTDLNFPETFDQQQQKSTINQRQRMANFTGLACHTNRTLKFMAFDSLIYGAFAESLGVDVFNVPHSTIALIIDPERESVHLLDHEILFDEIEIRNVDSKSAVTVPRNSYSKIAFIEFIRNFTDGKLPRFYRNHRPRSSGFCNDYEQQQMIIERNGSNIVCVPELNTMTFLNLIVGKPLENQKFSQHAATQQHQRNDRKFLDKDIVVMYYAPWCGFCSSIAHVYLDVARIFDFSDDIIFSRINGDSNDLPWEYTVDRYPTIIFFPARKRSNSVTYPPSKAVDRSGLFKFILDNAQQSVRLRMSIALCQKSCLKRSYQTNYWQRQKTERWISSTLNELSFIHDELRKIDARLKTAKDLRERKRLQEKRNVWKRFELQCILRRIHRHRRIQWKQILLNQFILMKIDHIQRYNFDFEHLNRQLQSLLMATVSTTKHRSNTTTSSHHHKETSHRTLTMKRSNTTKSSRLPKLIKRRKDEL